MGRWTFGMQARRRCARGCATEREFFIDNLLVRIHFIIVMIRWTGLAPWEFEFPFPGSLTSDLLQVDVGDAGKKQVCAGLRGKYEVPKPSTLNPQPSTLNPKP